jgi:uncharacterized protein involved in exopolysaccharide biosynthesis
MTYPANLSRRSNSENRSTVRRLCRWAIPTGVLLAGIAAFAVIQSGVPVYRAQALLEANTSYLAFPDVNPSAGDLATKNQALIYNAIVLDPVRADPNLRDAPSFSDPEAAGENLRKNLSVVSASSEQRMSVTYDDTDPEAAAKICNAVVYSYLRQRGAFDDQRLSNLERWIAPEIERWERVVEEEMLVVQKLGTPGITAEIQSNIALLAKIRAQISDLQVEIALHGRMHSSSTKSGSEDDTSQQVKDPNREEMELRLEVLREEYQALLRNAEQLGRGSAKHQFAKDELAIANDVLKKLRERVAMLRTERRRGGPVLLLYRAFPPTVPIDSFPTKRIAVAAGTGFLLPFVIALLVGFRRPSSVNTDDD